ncbi:MAG: methyl-accepting chemotaxis protein, partial [Deltaproteobacteria bacterium]|nr:methyl-accepting chemotaxis protein [Deltaproteobacteria bacterium]
ASQALSQGASEQAASLEEISASMTEIASQTKANAEHAVLASQLAAKAKEDAANGNIQMTEMTTAMKDINDSSKEIAKIIKTIDDIAFQTNLLALNAAVEAARAGKHGKGFAVVAQEVRNLAGRSAKAAQETAELIDGSVKKVENGAILLKKSAQGLNDIVTGALKVSELVAEIASASNEQAQGISQINQGLSQIEQVTHQNTANAEQTAAASEELTGQAMHLSEIVSHFKLNRHGGPDGSGKASPPSAVAEKHLIAPRPHGPKNEINRVQTPRIIKPNQTIKPEEIISLDDRDFGKY